MKMSEKELDESKELAEELKGKEDVDNPHALSRWLVQRDAAVPVESGLQYMELKEGKYQAVG